jgi:hypothetical protein
VYSPAAAVSIKPEALLQALAMDSVDSARPLHGVILSTKRVPPVRFGRAVLPVLLLGPESGDLARRGSGSSQTLNLDARACLTLALTVGEWAYSCGCCCG